MKKIRAITLFPFLPPAALLYNIKQAHCSSLYEISVASRRSSVDQICLFIRCWKQLGKVICGFASTQVVVSKELNLPLKNTLMGVLGP